MEPHNRVAACEGSHGGGGCQALSYNLKFFSCKRIRGGVLIQRVKRRSKGKKRRDTLDDLPEPSALIIRQWFSVAAIRLSIAKPRQRNPDDVRRPFHRKESFKSRFPRAGLDSFSETQTTRGRGRGKGKARDSPGPRFRRSSG
jgi:hypothetical protein